MLASESKLGRVEVARPLGKRPSTVETPPSRTSTRSRAIAAALRSPGSLPARRLPRRNCAVAKAAATVVRSFTVARPGIGPAPSTLARR